MYINNYLTVIFRKGIFTQSFSTRPYVIKCIPRLSD